MVRNIGERGANINDRLSKPATELVYTTTLCFATYRLLAILRYL